MNVAVIDCSARPYENGVLRIVHHDPGASHILWSPDCCNLYRDASQLHGQRIQGDRLRTAMKQQDIPVVNACVLDFLLNHPDQIPASFESVQTFFWGTTYEFPVGGPHGVRYLARHDGRWVSGIRWFVGFWGECDYALMWR